MAKSLLVGKSDVPFADNTTTYWAPFSSVYGLTGTDSGAVPIRNAGTLRDLKTYVSANTTLVTTTITVRVSGADGALTVNYTSGQTGEKQDTANSDAVADTDEIGIKVVVANDASGATEIALRSTSLEYETDTPSIAASLLGAGGALVTTSTASTTYYLVGCLDTTLQTTERGFRILEDLELSHLWCEVETNGRSTDTTYRVRKNAGNGNQSVTFASGETGTKEDTSNADSFASGDDVCWSLSTGTGAGNITTRVVACVVAGVEFVCLNGVTTGTLCNGANNYLATSGYGRTTTQANAQDRIGFGARLTDYRASASANTATGSCVATLRVEGSASALAVTFATGETGLKTDTDRVVVAADNLLGHHVSRGGSGGITLTYLGFSGWDGTMSTEGIASTLAFGTGELSELTMVSLYATGIASIAAVGTPNLDAALSASGVASTEAHGTASVDVTLTASGIASTLALGTPNLDASVYATGIASTAAAGTPALTGSLTASGIASTAALGTPALTSALTASGIASTSALGTPNLDASLYASWIASTSAAGTPGLSVALGASGIASGAALGTPWLTGALSVAGIASTATIPTPALAVTLGASGVASTTTVPTPGLAASLGASGIASGAAVGTPGIWSAATVTGIASTEAWGTPTLSVQLYAEGIASTLVIGSHRRSLVDAAGTATLDRSLSGGVTLVRAVEDDVTIDRSLVGGVTITDSAAGAVTLARSLTGTVSGG